MNFSYLAGRLWGKEARFRYLFVASLLLLFTLLGEREIWTQEHRWADIVSGMFYRNDFLHPYLGENRYYDKPLLSYWLIVLFAKVSGTLSTFALRIPSALSGLLAIAAIYRLGCKVKDKQLGLLSGWMLLTTFYFIFWSRTSSADMLNLAGSLFAIAWYFDKRDQATFYDYSIFFLIIALTSLCKGLIGAVVPAIAVLTDMTLQHSWKKHLRSPLFLSLLPALIIYFAPFVASSYYDHEAYGQNGLYLVYRENFLRYFQPFDHEGPIYTYFVFLPIYLMPWTLFFVPALWSLRTRWKMMSLSSKWVALTLLFLFLFFTLSGSRRSYYVLPLVPFAILFTAEWTRALDRRQLWSAGLALFSFILFFLVVDVSPLWYNTQYGVKQFATALKREVNKTSPWETWNVVMLDAQTKLNFYLQLPPHTKNYQIKGSKRRMQTKDMLFAKWSLDHKPEHTIFITRKLYLPLIRDAFVDYHKLEIPSQSENAPIAFIPRK